MGDCADTALLEDVLGALADLLRHTPGGRIPHLAGAGGAQLFLGLLSREQPGLRVLGLRLLAHFLPYLHAAKGEMHCACGPACAAMTSHISRACGSGSQQV